MLSLPPSMVAPRVCGDDLKGHWPSVSSSAFRLSWLELHYGVMKTARVQQNRTTIAALHIAVWPFDIEDAEEAGDIRFTLERAGTPIGPFDILIAAQARRRGALLVTANGSEFGRVPGLRFDDWASPD